MVRQHNTTEQKQHTTGVSQHRTAQCDATQHKTERLSTMQHTHGTLVDAAQHIAAQQQHNAEQRNTTRHKHTTAQYRQELREQKLSQIHHFPRAKPRIPVRLVGRHATDCTEHRCRHTHSTLLFPQHLQHLPDITNRDGCVRAPFTVLEQFVCRVAVVGPWHVEAILRRPQRGIGGAWGHGCHLMLRLHVHEAVRAGLTDQRCMRIWLRGVGAGHGPGPLLRPGRTVLERGGHAHSGGILRPACRVSHGVTCKRRRGLEWEVGWCNALGGGPPCLKKNWKWEFKSSCSWRWLEMKRGGKFRTESLSATNFGASIQAFSAWTLLDYRAVSGNQVTPRCKRDA